jgi:hypothetical protein
VTDWTIEQANAVKWAKRYEGPQFHFLFCDPPYELGFMNRAWDATGVSFDPATWAAFYPLMHDGAFGAAYAAARNWHRMACAIEDAGFFIHDTLFLWVQGQGMTKGTRVDRHYQEQRHGWDGNGMVRNAPAISNQAMLELSLQERLALWREERRWQGHRYGLQTLAPRVEPILIFQKPWSAGVQRDSVIATGAGCMNVDGCRVGTDENLTRPERRGHGTVGGWANYEQGKGTYGSTNGRWPSNFGLVHSPGCVWVGEKRVRNPSGSVNGKEPSHTGDENTVCYGEYDRVPFARHADPDGFETVDDWACSPGCPARRLGEMSGDVGGKWGRQGKEGAKGLFGVAAIAKSSEPYIGDHGTAARFFPQFDWRYDIAERLLVTDPVRYVPKVGTTEREAGLKPERLMKLRDDLTPEQRRYVLGELARLGINGA